MRKPEYRAYTKTVMYLTEEQVAGIIKFHPEERSKIKEVSSKDSWEKVEAFLNFRSDSLTDYPYQKILEKNLFDAYELEKYQLDNSYEPKEYKEN